MVKIEELTDLHTSTNHHELSLLVVDASSEMNEILSSSSPKLFPLPSAFAPLGLFNW